MGVEPLWGVGLHLAGLGIGAYLTPWARLSAASGLISEYHRREAASALADTMGDEQALAGDHPMHAIATRLRQLGADDARVTQMVDDLVGQIARVEGDAASLAQAVSAEQSLATSADDPRVQRLSGVLADKQSLAEQLIGALRDLHVELTVRHNEDHEALFAQVSDLLAGISAQTEVDQAVASAAPSVDAEAEEAARKRRAQAMQASKDPS